MFYQSVGFECILFAKNECSYTCNEREIKCFEDTVRCYKTKEGDSYRFVMYVDNKAVSALQIMVGNGTATAANVFTVKEYRRKGFSKIVFQEALKHFRHIQFSNNRSQDGKRYVEFCETIIQNNKRTKF